MSFILKWLTFAVVLLVWGFATLLSTLIYIPSLLVIGWILAAFCDEDGNLIYGRKLWQTFDASCDEGRNCRQRELAAGLGGDTWTAFNAFPLTAWEDYKNRALWLFRNSCYGWSYYVFGIPWVKADWTIHTYEDTPERTFFFATSGYAFNLYYHGRWGMYKLGWKAWNVHTVVAGIAIFTDNAGMGGLGRIPLVISANPFKRK